MNLEIPGFSKPLTHQKPHKKLFRPVALLLICIGWLAACSTAVKKPEPPEPAVEVSQEKEPADPISGSRLKSVEQLLKKAEESLSPKREAYLLRAVQLALIDQTLDRATQIYDIIHLDSVYSVARLAFYYEKIGTDLYLTLGEMATAGQNLAQAQAILERSQLLLNPQERESYLKTSARFYEKTGNFLHLARLEIFSITGQEDPETLQIIHERIWNALIKVPESQLQQILASHAQVPPHEDYKAWLDLAFLMKSGNSNLSERIKLLGDWHTRWAHTKVAIHPPLGMQRIMRAEFKDFRHIALLVPSNGPFKYASQAILEGVLTSHYKRLEESSAAILSVYDTYRHEDILGLYQKAVLEGADFVIGPLQKDNVKILLEQESLPIPVLALNYVPVSKKPSETLVTNEVPSDAPNPENPQQLGSLDAAQTQLNTTNYIQIGLKAEDEAIQVAKEAKSLGHKRAMILYPDSDWGFRMATAFSDTWTQEGGIVVASQIFTKPENYSKEIKEALNITNSEQRRRSLSQHLNVRLEFEPRRRKDIDMIFIAASPVQARQLKPTLNFHYAESLPVYASSHVYEGFENLQQNLDLENVMFLDIPWILSEQVGLKAYFHKTWPSANSSFKRLHALGIDAYRLMQHYSLIETLPNFSIPGATGLLHVDVNHIVNRELSWAKFKKGKVIAAQPESLHHAALESRQSPSAK